MTLGLNAKLRVVKSIAIKSCVKYTENHKFPTYTRRARANLKLKLHAHKTVTRLNLVYMTFDKHITCQEISSRALVTRVTSDRLAISIIEWSFNFIHSHSCTMNLTDRINSQSQT